MKNRDQLVLETLIGITDEVATALKRFEIDSFAKFMADPVIKRATTMCLISLSESVDLLTTDFRVNNAYINFKVFKALRNIAAHKYGSINFEMVWEIITKSLPKYRIEFQRLLDKLLREQIE